MAFEKTVMSSVKELTADENRQAFTITSKSLRGEPRFAKVRLLGSLVNTLH